jgi:hypothetical protein
VHCTTTEGPTGYCSSSVPPQKDQLVTVAAVFPNQGQSCGGDKPRGTCNSVRLSIEMGPSRDHLMGRGGGEGEGWIQYRIPSPDLLWRCPQVWLATRGGSNPPGATCKQAALSKPSFSRGSKNISFYEALMGASTRHSVVRPTAMRQ